MMMFVQAKCLWEVLGQTPGEQENFVANVGMDAENIFDAVMTFLLGMIKVALFPNEAISLVDKLMAMPVFLFLAYALLQIAG